MIILKFVSKKQNIGIGVSQDMAQRQVFVNTAMNFYACIPYKVLPEHVHLIFSSFIRQIFTGWRKISVTGIKKENITRIICITVYGIAFVA